MAVKAIGRLKTNRSSLRSTYLRDGEVTLPWESRPERPERVCITLVVFILPLA